MVWLAVPDCETVALRVRDWLPVAVLDGVRDRLCDGDDVAEEVLVRVGDCVDDPEPVEVRDRVCVRDWLRVIV